MSFPDCSDKVEVVIKAEPLCEESDGMEDRDDLPDQDMGGKVLKLHENGYGFEERGRRSSRVWSHASQEGAGTTFN
ncbi:hypothetical protein HF086_009552 [Spodoptera exigua]|uniref:Uncharacterized protein n=1 Tax=Spodoptera exigua TaxID=7107 RepID=A0A922MFH1_SPOEX|nr:hypothetical protein HF086_009552 [Spodoptera exigua]